MKKIRAVAALGLGIASLVLLPTSRADAAATCQGQPATIEASAGTVMGTPGPDVIVVTGTVTVVDAGDGDDRICLVGTVKLGDDRHWLDVAAGAGNDVVDVSQAGAKSDTDLGPGVDAFTGSAFKEWVRVGGSYYNGGSDGDLGPDTIDTGAGKDALSMGPSGVVVDARLGAGEDLLSFFTSRAGPGSTFDLGAGRDRLGFEDEWESPDAGETTLRVNMPREVLEWRGVRSELRNAESIWAVARRIVVRGDDGANSLSSYACDVIFRGGDGEDRTSLRTIGIYDTQPFKCRPGEVRRAYGNAGDDFLGGGRSHDVLVGGPGRDKAHGGPDGDDVCIAEIVAGKGCRRSS
jgi:Ca2+-binding RTX toxin-like protein